MNTTKRARTQAAKKAASTQSGSSPKNLPGKPQPETTAHANEISPRETEAVKLGPFDESPNGYVATVHVSDDIYLSLGKLAMEDGHGFSEAFRRVVVGGLRGLLRSDLWTALQNAKSVQEEMFFLMNTMQQAEITRHKESGEPTDESFNRLNNGFYLLTRRLDQAMNAELDAAVDAVRALRPAKRVAA